MGIEDIPDDVGDPPMYYDPDGRPVSLRTWALMREGYCHVAKDFVGLPDGRHAIVSTVWVGIDTNWGGGPPLIYETAIFDLEGRGSMDYQRRFATRTQALAGHDQAVEYAKNLGVVPQDARDSET